MPRRRRALASAGVIALAIALFAGSAPAQDRVVRTDGTVLEGRVISLTPAAVTIETNGMQLEVPRSRVQEVTLEGAGECQEEVATLRGLMAQEKHREAAQALVASLERKPDCEALAEVALALLSLPKDTLDVQTVQQVVRVSRGFPQLGTAIMNGQFELDRKTMIELGIIALTDAKEGPAFVEAHKRVLKLYQAQLKEAMEKNDTRLINATLLSIAELYRDNGKPVENLEQLTRNQKRNVVDRMAHAVLLIPLPEDFRQSAPSLKQLRSLSSSEVQSARDRVAARMESYFFEQGRRIGQKLVESGDFPAFQEQLQAYSDVLPPEATDTPRMDQLLNTLKRTAEVEALAWNEYNRLRELASADNPMLVDELDSQLLRFQNSHVWTLERRDQLKAEQERLRALIQPAATPADAAATPSAPADPAAPATAPPADPAAPAASLDPAAPAPTPADPADPAAANPIG